MNFKMKAKIPFSQFVRPYSKGQITIPQKFRKYLGITSNDWLFLTIKNDYLAIKPIKEEKVLSEKKFVVEPKTSFKNYLKILSGLKGTFGPELEKENKQIRKEVEKRLEKLQF